MILLIVVSTLHLFVQQNKIDSLYTNNLCQLENKKLLDTNLYAANMKVAFHSQSYNRDFALNSHNNARNVASQLKDNYRIDYLFFKLEMIILNLEFMIKQYL